jgi:hypothetical protein
MSVQYAVSSWSAAVLRRLPCRAIELLFACRDVCQCRRRIDFERPKFLVSNLFAERDQALLEHNGKDRCCVKPSPNRSLMHLT